MPTILIVEDEAKMRRLLELNLGDDGFTTLLRRRCRDRTETAARKSVDLVLTDLKLPGMNGLEFLQTVKRQNAALPVVVMTAFGSVETAVDAMKAGASDYVLKPFSLSRNADGDPQGTRCPQPARRKPLSARGVGQALFASQHCCAQPEDAGGAGDGGARRAHQFHCAAGRRERRGQRS